MSLMHNPPHPGEVLRDWLEGHTTTEAAKKLGVARVTLSRILNGSAGISAEMDLRLSQALGTTPGFWVRMQAERDLAEAKKSFRIKVKKIIPAAARVTEAA
ncbi:HigA family addiction module antitoxin [Montanilutibacter psychrotolerans]|uniref:Addiction module antidote protein, HigA family n=1 Tax=Montanilutibacter psychrotolerans TaxID=1327343 RepID=A0A3M8SVM1_9GAMM|nr:HigA family addiction module antitoxin [Lysobacter psychrotolerans]RNF85388.1 addiction module antidote protein, HigA family [Lysobacter psychrotolerans]